MNELRGIYGLEWMAVFKLKRVGSNLPRIILDKFWIDLRAGRIPVLREVRRGHASGARHGVPLLIAACGLEEELDRKLPNASGVGRSDKAETGI